MVRYTKSGNYVAVCNTLNFDGYYTIRFTVESLPEGADALWHFLNRVSLTACVDRIYPAEIFDA